MNNSAHKRNSSRGLKKHVIKSGHQNIEMNDQMAKMVKSQEYNDGLGNANETIEENVETASPNLDEHKEINIFNNSTGSNSKMTNRDEKKDEIKV